MFNEQVTYPYIKKMKELIEAYQEFEIKMLPENFTKPTPQAWYRIYLEIGARMNLCTPEKLSSIIQLSDDQQINPNYAYFYREGIDNINLCLFIQGKLKMCAFDGEPFTLNDLFHPTYPNKTRLHKILSCFLNYLRFAHNVLPHHTEQIMENERELERNENLEKQMVIKNDHTKTDYISEFNKKLLEAKNKMQENHQELKHEVSHLENVRAKCQQLDDVINQLHTQHDTNAVKLDTMTASVKGLTSNVIEAPDELQNKMASLNDVNSHLTTTNDECHAEVCKTRVEDGETEQIQSECAEFLSSFDSFPTTNNKKLTAELKVKKKFLHEKLVLQESIIKKYESLSLKLEECNGEMTAKQTALTAELRELKKFKEKQTTQVSDLKAQRRALDTEINIIERTFKAERKQQIDMIAATQQEHEKIMRKTEELMRKTMDSH